MQSYLLKLVQAQISKLKHGQLSTLVDKVYHWIPTHNNSTSKQQTPLLTFNDNSYSPIAQFAANKSNYYSAFKTIFLTLPLLAATIALHVNKLYPPHIPCYQLTHLQPSFFTLENIQHIYFTTQHIHATLRKLCKGTAAGPFTALTDVSWKGDAFQQQKSSSSSNQVFNPYFKNYFKELLPIILSGSIPEEPIQVNLSGPIMLQHSSKTPTILLD